MALAAGKKKTRKPYTITRPREKWTADEHGRFLHALHLFGRDWKSVEQFVATKTATQIRSHAQKHFLRAQKQQGRAAFLPQATSYCCQAMPAVSGVEQSVEWAGACWPGDGLLTATPNWSEDQPGASTSEACCFADASLPDETVHFPLSPDDPSFAQVYRFIGDVFGSDAPLLNEAQVQRLQDMDPVIAETILVVLNNFQVNLFA